MQSRTPITDGNIAAHEADIAARVAAGHLSREAAYGTPQKRAPVRGGAIRHAMTQAILETGEGCTPADLLGRFTQAEIDTYGPQAAAEAIKAARLN